MQILWLKKGKITKQIVKNKKVKNGKNNTKASKKGGDSIVFYFDFINFTCNNNLEFKTTAKNI